MSPPAPIPEHEFLKFLRENGCRGERKGSEYAAYRESDGRLVSTYAVKHPGKREVKYVYKRNFEKALKKIEEEEELVEQEEETSQVDNQETWKDTEWYQKQKELEDQWEGSEPQESEQHDE